MDLGEKIKNLRLEQHLTLEEVGQRVGVGKSTVRKWESGAIKNMRRDKIAKVANALGVSPGYLMGWKEDNPKPAPQHQLPDVPGRELVSYAPPPVMVPVIGSVRCGEGGLAVQEYEGEEPANVDHPENYFFLRASGDSMEPRIFDGDLVLVRQQDDVESGEIAVVVVDGEEGTLKRVIKKPGIVVLEPFNHTHETRYFAGKEANKIRIVGKAIRVEGRL